MSHVPVFNNVLNLKHACVCGRLHTVDESLTSSLPALGQAPPTFFFLPGCPFKSHSSFPSSHISCLGFFFFVWWWFLRPSAVRQDTEILSCLLVILVGQKWQKKKKSHRRVSSSFTRNKSPVQRQTPSAKTFQVLFTTSNFLPEKQTQPQKNKRPLVCCGQRLHSREMCKEHKHGFD